MNNHKIIMPSGSGTPSRIQNSDNTQFVNTNSSGTSLILKPRFSFGAGFELGEYSLGTSHFKLKRERIFSTLGYPLKSVINIETIGSGGSQNDKLIVEIGEGGVAPEIYQFAPFEENKNNVARVKDIQDAVDTIANMLGVV